MEAGVRFPLLIAMKDDLRSRELAAFLQCLLIDQNDVSAYLVTLEKTQLFEVVCQIASTQLSLNLNVIVNYTFSHTAPIGKLVQLANSYNARFVIIESETEDTKDDKYRVKRILKLRVDMESFDVKKVVFDISTWFYKNEKKMDIKYEEKNKVRRPTIDHLHALNLLEKPRKDELVCKSCSKLLSGPSYHCVECDEFNLHKSCAEFAPNVTDCPPFLTAMKPAQYDFQEMYKCGDCEEFLYDCCDCLLQTHLNHGFLPTILYHKQHQRFLNFIIMPFKYSYQYKCCICDKPGSSVSYKCYDCFYDVHVNCILPHTIQMKNGQYSFVLRFCYANLDEPASENHCDICNGEIDFGQLFYQCHDLDIKIHLRCLSDESQLDVLINDKEASSSTAIYESEEDDSIPFQLTEEKGAAVLRIHVHGFQREQLSIGKVPIATETYTITVSGDEKFEIHVIIENKHDVRRIAAKFENEVLTIAIPEKRKTDDEYSPTVSLTNLVIVATYLQQEELCKMEFMWTSEDFEEIIIK